jgi:hypothetical protein
MKKITQDQEKIKLVKRLVENQQITFEQSLLLLEVEVEYQYLPCYQIIPYYDPYKITWTTSVGETIAP